MKYFIGFLISVFVGVFALKQLQISHKYQDSSKTIFRVFASSSFRDEYGPGPKIKELFEKTCQCKVEFLDSSDSSLLIQRLKTQEAGSGVDFVMGLDQLDLDSAEKAIQWKKVVTKNETFEPLFLPMIQKGFLIPYNYGFLTFNARPSLVQELPASLEDLLKPEFKGQIALQDPRTSSPGFQFISWLIQLYGEEGAFQYLSKLGPQVHSYSPSWSGAYGHYSKGQAKLVFSYSTSPIYHQLNEASSDFQALQLKEGLPLQVEFFGVPAACTHCELAQTFANLVLSVQGQKIIMEKNYMLPVIQGVLNGTPFEKAKTGFAAFENFQWSPVTDRERIIKRWSEWRRSL